MAKNKIIATFQPQPGAQSKQLGDAGSCTVGFGPLSFPFLNQVGLDGPNLFMLFIWIVGPLAFALFSHERSASPLLRS